jgi:pimeloyl-ACP methyl ester carboxylesterase
VPGLAPEERFLQVARTARYYRTGAPAPSLRQAWLVCHGYGQLASAFLHAFQPIADPTRLIVAPEALNRYYPGPDSGPHGPESPVAATWMTREDRLHEIDDYVRYLDRVFDDAIVAAIGPSDRPHAADAAPSVREPPSLEADASAAGARAEHVATVALGFSQGGATIARWAARTAHRIDAIVLWGAVLPPELEPAPDLFTGARLILAHGARDRFMTDDRLGREAERMRRDGLDFELFRYEAGHRIEPDALVRLAASLDPPP